MKRYASLVPTAMSILLSPLGSAAVQTAAPGEVEGALPDAVDEIVAGTVGNEVPDAVEEIIVYGDRPLFALRRDVYRAEQNYFDLFNTLNDDDEFDVHCYYEVPSFTHIRRHVCRARFVVEANSREGRQVFHEEVGAFDIRAEYEIQEKTEILRQKMETLSAEKPELASALMDYANAKQVYESEMQKRTGADEE